MNMLDQFLWVIFPYIMLTVFVVGHIYRYNSDQYGWTAKSSEFLEKASLRRGSMMFHFGILMVTGGHVMGLLVPAQVTSSLGITPEMYHMGAIVGGSTTGIISFIGLLLIMSRRFTNDRVKATSSFSDKLIVILLFAVMLMGLSSIVASNVGGSGFDYRTTIAPWLRGLLLLSPDSSLMATVPMYFKMHVFLGFLVFGVWPFTRLVHVWSVPVKYLARKNIVYRTASKRFI